MAQSDTVFSGSLPELYDSYLGPILFAPYASEVARRMAGLAAGPVLETACGTGIVTRALRAALPPAVAITATDLNQAMIDHAAGKSPGGITWQQADALALPFPDAHFTAGICQFGVMFFPDRAAGYREALRVLRPGAPFLFAIWGDLAANPMSDLMHRTVAAHFPADPPGFFARVPHAYADQARIRADVTAAGGTCSIETLALPTRAASARRAAIGFCQGTPLRAEILARDPAGLEPATAAVVAAFESRYGTGAIEDTMTALLVTVRR